MDRTFLILGGGGMVGMELARQILREFSPPEGGSTGSLRVPWGGGQFRAVAAAPAGDPTAEVCSCSLRSGLQSALKPHALYPHPSKRSTSPAL
jgi:hypothetical protein